MTTASDAEPRTYDVAVLRKMLDLVETLVANGPAGVTELSAMAGVSKPAAFRILSTLEGRGYVEKDASSRKYSSGPSLIKLSGSVLAGLELVQQARPVLEQLHERFGETVNLGVAVQAQVVYIDILERTSGLRTTVQVGSGDPMVSTALGKAILSSMTAEEAHAVYSRQAPARRTPRTIVDWKQFRAELASTAARGYAVDNEENEIGSRCVAAAIFDAGGRPSAAMSISGPVSRIRDDQLAEIGEQLIEAAATVERLIGGRRPPHLRFAEQ